MTTTKYKSKLYYDIVISDGNYNGYYTTFVGYPTMRFTNGLDIINITSPNTEKNWMKYCWNLFIKSLTNNHKIKYG